MLIPREFLTISVPKATVWERVPALKTTEWGTVDNLHSASAPVPFPPLIETIGTSV